MARRIFNQFQSVSLEKFTENQKFEQVTDKCKHLTPSKHETTICVSPFHSLNVLANVASVNFETVSQPEDFRINSTFIVHILYKLKTISVASNLNENYLKQAKEILSDFEFNPLKFTTCNTRKFLQLPQDPESRIILSYCERTFRKWRPLCIEPDGNCLFNTIAVFLCGTHSSDMARRLRIAVVAELLFNRHLYHNKLKDFCNSGDADFIDEEIISEMRSAGTLGKWCGYVSFAALATVVAHPIRLISPIASVPTVSGFAFNSHIMNSVILPIRGESSMDTIHVLLAGNADQLESNPAAWRSNHFILLIDPSATPDISDANASKTASALVPQKASASQNSATQDENDSSNNLD